MPTLSIIVPVYNNENYLEDCILSIVNQTYKDFELLLIDDGSIDRSGEICDHWRNRDKRVTVIHQTNSGVSAARNAGLELAKGNYIGFVDSDDIIDVDMYEFLLERIIQFNADIAICGVRRIFPNQVEIYGGNGICQIYDSYNAIAKLLVQDILSSCYDKIYKRILLKDIRFEQVKYLEDMYFNLEAFTVMSSCVYDDHLKYNYIIHPSSVTMRPYSENYLDMITISKKILEYCNFKHPKLKINAQSFDFSTNFSLLNLIILASDSRFKEHYIKIRESLKSYNFFYLFNPFIKMKYKIGYSLCLISPKLYAKGLYIYSNIRKSENLKRQQNI